MSGSIPGIGIPPAPGTFPALVWNGREWAASTALALASLSLTGALTAASGTFSGALAAATLALSGQFTSTLATGTPPLVIASTTNIPNLNASSLNGATFAAPGAIGSGTPSTGAFTTLGGTVISASTDFLGPNGSAGTPAFSFTNSPTTGFFRQAADAVGLSLAGTEVMRVTSAGWIFNRNAVASGTTPITAGNGVLTVHAADTTACYFQAQSYGATAGIEAKRANGTAAALTGLVNNNAIYTLNIQGYEPTTPGYSSAVAAHTVQASETWSSTAQGTRHQWITVANGGTATANAMRLENSGSLLIGTTTDGMTAAGSLAVAQDLAHRGTKFGFMNTAPIVQKTGYGTPTGNSYQASFAAGSITLPNLAAAVAQLILDLKAYGMIGA